MRGASRSSSSSAAATRAGVSNRRSVSLARRSPSGAAHSPGGVARLRAWHPRSAGPPASATVASDALALSACASRTRGYRITRSSTRGLNCYEAALLSELSQHIIRSTNTTDAFEAAAQCARQLTPSTVLALYRYRPDADILVCEMVVGDGNGFLTGLSITVGQRVTGWAAANRKTSVTSDALLDVAQIANLFEPPLRSALSTPLVIGDRLLGVLSGYSVKGQAFSDEHGYTFEYIATLLAARLVTLSAGRSDVTAFSRHRHTDSSR